MSVSTGLQCCQPWESRVCLCRNPQCLCDIFFVLLNLFLPFWEMFRERHDNTVLPTLRVTCLSVSESPVFIWNLLRPSQPVSSLLRDVLRTAWQHSAANPESHVCVCVGSPSVCMIHSSTFATCFFPPGRCFAKGMTTLWSMLLTWATIRCMLESRKPYKHLHSGSWKENKRTSVTFRTDGNIPISLHVFAFIFIVEQDI